jgi:hypothetical protein
MQKKHIIILGGNIIGLYAALQCSDLGYIVTIIEKKHTLGNVKYMNYNIFNTNHKSFINLLNRFQINYVTHNITNNEKIYTILGHILNKSKLIPKKILISQSFAAFCNNLLTSIDYDTLKKNIDNFEYIYSNITAMDCINMFTYDINNNLEYFKLIDDISILINRIIAYLKKKEVIIINDTEIKDFKYINNMFNIYSNDKIFTANYLIVTLSKKNLLKYKFWNTEQKKTLNNVSRCNIDISNIYKLLNNNTDENNIRRRILNDSHITFPNIYRNINNDIYIWNIGCNNTITREKIKYLYNSKIYLCSESYSKNIFFINYSLDTFESNFPKISKIVSK